MNKVEENHHYLAIAVRTGGNQEIIGTYKTDQEATDAYFDWDRAHDHDSEKGEVWCIDLRPGFDVRKPTSNKGPELKEKIINNWRLLAWYFVSMHVASVVLFGLGFWVSIERHGSITLSLHDFLLLGGMSGFIAFSYQAYSILKH